MNVYIARFSLPRSLDELDMMLESDGRTDLQVLLDEEDVAWQMPRSCFTGDVVFFQLGNKAPAQLRHLKRSAQIESDQELVDELTGMETTIDRCAGSLVAVGRVGGRPFEDAFDSGRRHFRGRIFAPVTDIAAFRSPVRVVGDSPLTELSAFAPAGPVTHRMFDSDDAYQQTLQAVEAQGNAVPAWAGRSLEVIAGDDPVVLLGRARDPGAGFFNEAHLRLHLAGPICAALSDEGRVRSEVRVNKLGRNPGIADYMIWLDGTPVPVEAKLNVTAEHDFLGQVEKYTGPARFGRGERIEHNLVLAIDRAGVYLLRDGSWVDEPEVPAIQRTSLTASTIERFRHRVLRDLQK